VNLDVQRFVHRPGTCIPGDERSAVLAGGGGHEYGTLPAGTDFDGIVARHTPQAA